jgi:hypothetical protein
MLKLTVSRADPEGPPRRRLLAAKPLSASATPKALDMILHWREDFFT